MSEPSRSTRGETNSSSRPTVHSSTPQSFRVLSAMPPLKTQLKSMFLLLQPRKRHSLCNGSVSRMAKDKNRESWHMRTS